MEEPAKGRRGAIQRLRALIRKLGKACRPGEIPVSADRHGTPGRLPDVTPFPTRVFEARWDKGRRRRAAKAPDARL